MDIFKNIEEENIIKEENIIEEDRKEKHIIKKTYWEQCQDFIEENRNTFFWLIVVFGIILIMNEKDNHQLPILYGGDEGGNAAAPAAAPEPAAPANNGAGSNNGDGGSNAEGNKNGEGGNNGDKGGNKGGKGRGKKALAAAASAGSSFSRGTGRSANVGDQDYGAFGAANYLLSFKYQISALIQMVAVTVFLIIVVMPPLSILIIGVLSFIMLKPNLKSLFRL